MMELDEISRFLITLCFTRCFQYIYQIFHRHLHRRGDFIYIADTPVYKCMRERGRYWPLIFTFIRITFHHFMTSFCPNPRKSSHSGTWQYFLFNEFFKYFLPSALWRHFHIFDDVNRNLTFHLSPHNPL